MQAIINANVATGEHDCDKLRSIIQGNILKIAEALAGELGWYSQNAQLVPESFQVISIKAVNSDSFKMLYEFSWDLFNPCLDLNETFTRHEEVRFHVKPGALVFDVIDNSRLSPADEL
ncbi:MAG: hypothetical protein K0S95_429 [Pantoea eucrina]|uniref:hypothetical protein n=1 Tax=Pantoea sp. SIMBA_079 TaxID=3085817 RepID=UPI0025E6C5A8|nr:hypothetical protein [uncultured Pantoea sp.]MDF2783894.1 hypothetical protein [Pantoea eucrina]